jgi:hypothetical protein
MLKFLIIIIKKIKLEFKIQRDKLDRPKYKIIPKSELKNKTKDILEKHDEIKLAYLFGSYALNRQNKFSDIDIGLVLDKSFKSDHLYFAEIASKIEKKFNYTIEVDIKILNDLPPRFLFEVINHGIILHSINQTFKNEFELKVIKDYLDIKPLLDFFDQSYINEAFKDEN